MTHCVGDAAAVQVTSGFQNATAIFDTAPGRWDVVNIRGDVCDFITASLPDTPLRQRERAACDKVGLTRSTN